MRIFFVCCLMACIPLLYAQHNAQVFSHGSVYKGTILKRDSVSKFIIVKIQGGSEFRISFNDIDSVVDEKSKVFPLAGKPFIGVGFGTALNSRISIPQLDFITGYSFNRKWSALAGFGISEVYAAYLGATYSPFHKKIFHAGFYSQIGDVLTPLSYITYDYYETRFKGWYTNTGLTFKLEGQKTRSAMLNIGYQFIYKHEIQRDYIGQETSKYYYLNRYLLQAIFTF